MMWSCIPACKTSSQARCSQAATLLTILATLLLSFPRAAASSGQSSVLDFDLALKFACFVMLH